MSSQKPKPQHWKNIPREFLLGGSATVCAVFFTNPVEVVKTRLQLQGELQRANKSEKKLYRGVFHTFFVIAKNEGILGLQKGLLPAALYQLTMNGIRLGLYEPFKKTLQGQNEKESHWQRVLAGAVSGATGATIGSPFFMIKTRLQARANSQTTAVGFQHKYKGMADAFASIWRTEGFAGLYTGVSVAAMRVCVGSGVQLSTYDSIKHTIVKSGYLGDNVYGHIASSLLTSFAVIIAMNPWDVLTTRMYNQPTENGKGKVYKNFVDCALKIMRTEGIFALYKGSLAHYMRLGPHTVLTFVFWEQLKKLARKYDL